MELSVHNSAEEFEVTPELFDRLHFEKAEINGLPYRICKVNENAPGAWRCLLHLHGAGSVGNDNFLQIRIAGRPLLRFLRNSGIRTLLVAPQCPKGKRWVEVDWGTLSHKMPEEPSEPMTHLMELVRFLSSMYGITPGNWSVCGISMGGYGAWDLVSRMPERFSSIFTMCGGADITQAPKLKHLRTLMVHGSLDTVVPTERSRAMMRAMEQAGAEELLYVERPECAHNVWTDSLADDRLLNWFFRKREKRLADIDKKMGASQCNTTGIRFRDVAEEPFELTGFPWFKEEHRFRRFPVHCDPPLPAGVELLAGNTSGGKVRFTTDSKRILVRVKRGSFDYSDNICYIGMAGFALYEGEPGKELFQSVTRTHPEDTFFTTELRAYQTAEKRTFTLYFPLYKDVFSCEIGLEEGASLSVPPPMEDPEHVIAVYGTSITQGGCATQPGNSYTNILSRFLRRHIVNFGFSGSGQGEPEAAEHVGRVKNVSLYLLDFEPNAGNSFAVRLPPFIRVLRKYYPEIPILVLSRYHYARSEVTKEWLAEIRASLATLQDANVHFIDGSGILGEEWRECLVDGVHGNDNAFLRMAHALEPEIRKYLR